VTAVRVVVVGGGPAGLAAAIQARELGADVTLLEAEHIGGTSLNRGPAPVRTLARAARLVRDWSSWERFGLEGPAPVPNLGAVLANSAGVARYAHDKKSNWATFRSQPRIPCVPPTGAPGPGSGSSSPLGATPLRCLSPVAK
jgi:pyruvate/2-oxoglutarate dehydrogenase complex dihydrolipoamide dehydrogenase (E3) component